MPERKIGQQFEMTVAISGDSDDENLNHVEDNDSPDASQRELGESLNLQYSEQITFHSDSNSELETADEISEVSNAAEIDRSYKENTVLENVNDTNENSREHTSQKLTQQKHTLPDKERRVSFHQKGGHVYARQTSKLDQSLTLSFGASNEDFPSFRSGIPKYSEEEITTYSDEISEVPNAAEIDRSYKENTVLENVNDTNENSKEHTSQKLTQQKHTLPDKERRVSFHQKGGHVYARQTSKLDQSLTLSFGASNEDFPSFRSSIAMSPRKKNRRQSRGFRTAFAGTRQSDFIDSFRISKNPTQMKYQRIEAFLYNHGMGITLGSLFLALNITMAAHGAYQFSEIGGWSPPNNMLRVTLPIARAGGRLVTLNCAILLLTACKYLWTLVRTYVVPVVPIGFPIDDVMPKYHRYVALTIIICGCIFHTIPQIVNYASGSITMEHEGIRVWTFGDGFATKQLLLTGTLLTIIFSTFFFTTLKAFRKTAAGFRWFWMFHITGIATAYPLLLIHGTCRGYPIFLFFAMLPLALYLFDLSMRRKNIVSANVLRWKLHDDDGQQITEVVLERPRGFSYTPGQYAELKFDPISTREWHPFTIASSPEEGNTNNDEVVFYIKNVGRWTGALANYAAAYDLSKALSPFKMVLRGPHGAPAMNYTEYKHIMVIGSGVGVTPLLSIWNYLVEKGKAFTFEKSIDFEKSMGSNGAKAIKGKSSQILTESVQLFNDEHRSRSFLMDFSNSVDFLNSASMQLDSLLYFESFDTLNENKSQSFSSSNQPICKKNRSMSFVLVAILESMTVSVPLFVLFVFGGTARICFQFTGWYLAGNAIASSLSLIAFLVHCTNIAAHTIAVGWSIYFRVFKSWLECSIIVANSFALWFSIRGCMMARGRIDASASHFTNSMISISSVIFLQAIRIFHIFYVNLKIQSSTAKMPSNPKKKSITLDDGAEFYSVDGIMINRKYSNIKFAARCILPRIVQDGLSEVFSMEFYGTREKPRKENDDTTKTQKSEISLVGDMMGSAGLDFNVRASAYFTKKSESKSETQGNFFCPGRPDWNLLFLKAISKAHATNEEGESVGVFFCGSPAIAKALKWEAKKVTAQHQFAVRSLYGKGCKCKIIVHSENF